MGQTGIGRLEFPLYTPQTPDDPDDTEWMKKVYFYVGKHQRLTGEVKKLAKPLAIIQTVEEGCSDEGGGSALEIRDVVKYKILFGGRPEPVGGE
jgi:chromosome transmission fidelity protein 8